jgi:hypothetical protein
MKRWVGVGWVRQWEAKMTSSLCFAFNIANLKFRGDLKPGYGHSDKHLISMLISSR